MKTPTPMDGAAYSKQVSVMADRALAWRKAHPDQTAQIVFNFPREVFMIVTMKAAIEKKIVTCNAAGLELVTALTVADEPDPSVFMVRMALEYEPPLPRLVKCPLCSHPYDTHMAISGMCDDEEAHSYKPRSGDVTVCFGCGEILQVTDTGLEKLREETFHDLPVGLQIVIRTAQAKLREMIAARKEPPQSSR